MVANCPFRSNHKMLARRFCLWFCLLSIIAWGTGCGVVPPVQSSGKRSFVGSFGPYNLESPEAVQEFNAQAKTWFTERGFVEVEEVTYHEDILRPYYEDTFPVDQSKEWNKPGVLLLLEHDHQNHVYVFIPDCFRPEDNTQYVGFHVRLAGTLKTVRDHEGGFDKMREDFLKQFPESPSPYR